MRFAFAVTFCALWAPSLAHAANTRAGEAPARITKASPAGAHTTIIYKSAADATTPCGRVIDEKALRDLVRKQARELGVDEKLALVILNLESNDGADLNSPKGARGPMQLMPATAAQYGVRDICDPAQNVHGALLFLKDLAAQFSGNVMLIAAAYNAGSERVYQANGVPAIAETVRYVADAANQYYDLAPLAARRGKTRSGRNDEARADQFASVAAAKPASRQAQDWIGGSVLYVSSDQQGDQ